MATDPIELLTSDHRTVDGLFDRLGSGSDPQVVNGIVKELSIHDAIERQFLYPAVRESIPDGGSVADHSTDEHNQIARLLADIDGRDDDDGDLPDLLQTLKGEVQRHVGEEENEIFPALRSNASPDRLGELGEQLAAGKKVAPTRPHPAAPDEGLGTMAAGAMVAPVDRLKDKAEGR
jgi:hemerythrin superfamily protein